MHAVLCANVVDRQKIGMVHRAQNASFVLEATEAIGIAGKGGRKNLDCNRAVEPGIAGAINLTHASCAQGRLNFVRSEFGAGSQRHGEW